jgi:hypothetical protein
MRSRGRDMLVDICRMELVVLVTCTEDESPGRPRLDLKLIFCVGKKSECRKEKLALYNVE